MNDNDERNLEGALEEFFAHIMQEALFGDCTRDEMVTIGRDLMPDCWDVDPTDDDRIRIRHGHKPSGCGAGQLDVTMSAEEFGRNLIHLEPPHTLMEAVTRVKAARSSTSITMPIKGALRA